MSEFRSKHQVKDIKSIEKFAKTINFKVKSKA